LRSTKDEENISNNENWKLFFLRQSTNGKNDWQRFSIGKKWTENLKTTKNRKGLVLLQNEVDILIKDLVILTASVKILVNHGRTTHYKSLTLPN
jgi:hypothetical protein